MNIFLQLTLAGADTGPFNLYTNNDYTIPFVSGVTKNDLTSGYYTTVPLGTTSVRIKSVPPSPCDNYYDVVLGSSPPTSTTTTTPAPYSVFQIAFDTPVPSLTGFVDGAAACAGSSTYVITLYTDPGNLTFANVLSNGDAFYTNPGLSSVFNGGATNNWYKTISPATNQAIRIDTSGFIDTSIYNC